MPLRLIHDLLDFPFRLYVRSILDANQPLNFNKDVYSNAVLIKQNPTFTSILTHLSDLLYTFGANAALPSLLRIYSRFLHQPIPHCQWLFLGWKGTWSADSASLY